MKKLAYRDLLFEEQTKAELKKALEAQQKMLNAWYGTGIDVPCTNLFQLMHAPQKVYGDAVKSQAEIPIAHGKFQISKDVFLNILDIPVPNQLYIAAREARNQIQAGRPELWSIEGNKVVMDQELANELIHSKDVYTENEAQERFVEATLKYIELSNYLVETIKAMPGMGMSFGMPFTLIEKHALINIVQLEPVQLRETLKSL